MLVNIHFQKRPLQFLKTNIYIVNIRGLEPRLRKMIFSSTLTLKIIFLSLKMRLNTMFITAVCVIFLIFILFLYLKHAHIKKIFGKK